MSNTTSNLVAELRKSAETKVFNGTTFGNARILMREAADVLERLQGSLVETTTKRVAVGFMPYHPRDGWDYQSFEHSEDDLHEIVDGWKWFPVYADESPVKTSTSQSGESNGDR